MTLSDAGLFENVVMGCVVDLPTSGRRWHKEIQRAEGDGSGGPVAGTEVILATVAGDVTRFVDRGAQQPLDASKTYIYRYRLTRVGSQDGTWSSWSPEQKPTDLTGQVVVPESSPPVTVSLSLDESTRQVRMQVGTTLGVQSIRYATSTSDYPTTATTHGSGTVVDTDASGDADVDPVATLGREETLFVTVLLYRQLSGSGSYVATARQSISDLPYDGPGVDATLVSATLGVERWEILPVPGTGAQGPYQVRHRTRLEGEDWPAWEPWQTVGTSTGNGLTVRVFRDGARKKILQFQARDTGRNNHTGDADTEIVKSILDLLDPPTTGRGPVEEERTRDGFGGEMPGRGRSTAPVYNRGRDVRRFEPHGGAMENTRLLGTNFIGSGLKGSDGQRSGYLQKAHLGGSLLHNGSINFPGGAYQAVPQVDLLHGWKTYDSGLTGDQIPLPKAVGLTASGFTLDARIWETVTSPATQQVSFSSSVISPEVGIDDRDFSAEMEDAADSSPAWDDRYVVNLDLSATAQQSFDCGPGQITDCQPTCDSGSITVGIYTNDGAGWMLRATVSQSADCTPTLAQGVEVPFYVSGLAVRSSPAGPEFATGVENESGLGGSYTPNFVEWETAGTPNSQNATANGNKVAWTSRAKEDA